MPQLAGGPNIAGPGVPGGGTPGGPSLPGASSGMPTHPSAPSPDHPTQSIPTKPGPGGNQPMAGAIGSAARDAEKTAGLVRGSTVSGMAMSGFLDSTGRKEKIEKTAGMSTEARRIAEGKAVMLDDKGHDLFRAAELEVKRGSDGRMRASVEKRYLVRELKTFGEKVDKSDKIMRERVERSWYQTSRDVGRRISGKEAVQLRTGKEALRYRAQMAGYAGTRAAIGAGRGLASYGWSRAAQSEDPAVRGVAGLHRANQARKRLARSKGLLRRRLKAKAYMLNHSKLLMRGFTSKNALAKEATKVVLAVASAFASVLMACLPMLLILLLIVMVAVALTTCSTTTDTSGLSGTERAVADYLVGKGFETTQIAAIMGNIQQESSFNPASTGAAYGLFQFDSSDGEEYRFFDWVASHGGRISDPKEQLDWVFEEGHEGFWRGRWQMYANSSGVPDPYVYRGLDGWRDEFASEYSKTPDEFTCETTLDYATFSWMGCYERCAPADSANISGRLRYAQEYYEKLTSLPGDQGVTGSGWGEAFANASESGRRIAQACGQVASPGSGLCAMWVSQVYQAAGFAYPSGNANNMFWNFCHSSNKDELKVGMIIAVPSWTGTSAGRTYGHVGIYIGDGKVMHNVGSIQTISLDDWINTYGTTYTPRWGWAFDAGGGSAE